MTVSAAGWALASPRERVRVLPSTSSTATDSGELPEPIRIVDPIVKPAALATVIVVVPAAAAEVSAVVREGTLTSFTGTTVQ